MKQYLLKDSNVRFQYFYLLHYSSCRIVTAHFDTIVCFSFSFSLMNSLFNCSEVAYNAVLLLQMVSVFKCMIYTVSMIYISVAITTYTASCHIHNRAFRYAILIS